MNYKEWKEIFKKSEPLLFDDKVNLPESFIKYVMAEVLLIKKKYKLSNVADAHDLFCVSHLSGKSYDKCWNENMIKGVKSGADGSIDTFFLEDGVLTMIQTKFSSIPRTNLKAMKDTYDRFVKGGATLTAGYENLGYFQNWYKENKSNIKKTRFIGTNPKVFEKSDPKYILLNWKTILIDSVSNIKKNMDIVVEEYSTNPLKTDETMVEKETNFVKLNGKHFIDQILEYNKSRQETIFEQNVRDHVVNTKFKNDFLHTIKFEAEKFEFYNNGLTIVSEEVTSSESNDISLKNPQIINGQQTTRTLINIAESGVDLSKISLYAKIIEVKDDDELIMKIAKYSNNQKSIKVGDLISATKGFKDLNKIAIENNYYIIAKQGKSEKKTFYKRIKFSSINIDDLIRADVAKNRKWLIPDAKNKMGSVKALYIKHGWLSEITKPKLKVLYKIIQSKNDLTDELKKEITNSITDEDLLKERKKLIVFADMFFYYRASIKQVGTAEILRRLFAYQDSVKGSLINNFKKWDGYVSLGMRKQEKPIEQEKSKKEA